MNEPANFRSIEGWRDQASIDEHLASPEFQSVMAEAGAIGVLDQQAGKYSVLEQLPAAF